MTEIQINKIVAQLQKTEARKKQLEREAEVLKQILKDELVTRGETEHVAETGTIRWKEITSNRLDSKALKVALPELFQRFTITTTSMRFSLV